MGDPLILLDDEQVLSFIINGYILLEPKLRSGLNELVCKQLDDNGAVDVDLQNDPHHQALLRKCPALNEVFAHPMVEGAFVSLLGSPYDNFGRHCHTIGPGGGGSYWHQDDVNVRHHQARRLTIMYYPQDVTPDMGPTVIVPGTHFRNLPTDRMQTYGNFKSQVPLTVKAGTVAVTHLDLWHSATRNVSKKTRYMIKYYLERLRQPTEPNWKHDPVAGPARMRQRFHHDYTGECSGSDHYKVRYLRLQMWQDLLGLTRLVNTAAADTQGYLMKPQT